MCRGPPSGPVVTAFCGYREGVVNPPRTHGRFAATTPGEKCSGHSESTRQCFPVAAEGPLCRQASRRSWAITPDRNDCTNKERGGLQEPSLGPKPPVNETSQGERASRVIGGGPKGLRNSWRPAIPRLFTRRQRKDFAPCTEVKLKVSRGSGKGIYEVRRQWFDSCRWPCSNTGLPQPSWRAST